MALTNVYIMQRTLLSIENNDIRRHYKVEPYHFQKILIVTEQHTGSIGESLEFEMDDAKSIEKVIKGIERNKHQCKVILGRHPSIPEEIVVKADVERHSGLPETAELYAALVKNNIQTERIWNGWKGT